MLFLKIYKMLIFVCKITLLLKMKIKMFYSKKTRSPTARPCRRLASSPGWARTPTRRLLRKL